MAKVLDTVDRTDAELAAAMRGAVPVEGFVRRLAERHGIAYAAAPTDAVAAAISRLSDAEHQPDGTEDLLLALARAGVISPEERLELHAAYLRQ